MRYAIRIAIAVLVAALGAVSYYLWTTYFGDGDPPESYAEKKAAIAAEEQARKTQAMLGRQAALRKVEADHAAGIKKLEQEGAARVAALRDDPVRLAGAAVRALQSSKRRARGL